MRAPYARIVAAAAAGLLSLAVSVPACAQDAEPELTEAICMTGREGDVPQVPREYRGSVFEIVVSTEDAERFETKGFTRSTCDSPRADIAQWRRYRDEVCALAAFGNDAVQNQLSRIIGEQPALLCTSAEKVAGKWDGNGRSYFVPRNYPKGAGGESPPLPEPDTSEQK